MMGDMLHSVSFAGKIPLYIRLVERARCFLTGKCEHRVYLFSGPRMTKVTEACQFCGKDFPLKKTEDVAAQLKDAGLEFLEVG